MSLVGVKNSYNELLNSVGTAGLNALYPNDFEAYFIALELVTSSDKTIEFFSFPILPSNITISEPEIISIKKVNRGVVGLKTNSFVPKDINITGNFGRNFRIILHNKEIDFNSFKGGLGISAGDFAGSTIKTGFGSIKILRNILEGSKSLDSSGNTTRLYFYNFAFSENYVVEVVDKSFSQSKETNMIWNYNITFKAVAPITESVRSSKSLISVLNTSVLQRSLNSLSSSINSAIKVFV